VEFPPAVAYGRLFFANNAGIVYAISANTGKAIWHVDSGRCQAMSPAVESGLVFTTFLNPPPCNAANGTGEVVAFEAGSGKVRWKHVIGASETSPLLVGRDVYVGDWDGEVYCFVAKTGRLRWRFQSDGKVKGGIAYADGRVYFGTYGSSVYALDAATGRELWKANAQPGFVSSGTFYSTPAVAYDRVYIGSTDGKMYSFGATTGELRWSQSTGGYVYSSPAVWNERVYAGSYSGSFFCFDAATGAILWSFRANGSISGSATVVAGRVYFSTLEGETYALDALSGREVWSFPDGKYSPVVADPTRLFLVGYTRLYGMAERRATLARHALRRDRRSRVHRVAPR
jgi:outer membrane protein assembly factor BamB